MSLMNPSPDPPEVLEKVTLEALQKQYLSKLSDRVERLRELLESAGGKAGGTKALQELHRAFHSLSGSGATYGLPPISEAAQAAESRVKEMLESGLPHSSDTRSKLAECIDKIDAARADALSSDSGGS